MKKDPKSINLPPSVWRGELKDVNVSMTIDVETWAHWLIWLGKNKGKTAIELESLIWNKFTATLPSERNGYTLTVEEDGWDIRFTRQMPKITRDMLVPFVKDALAILGIEQKAGMDIFTYAFYYTESLGKAHILYYLIERGVRVA